MALADLVIRNVRILDGTGAEAIDGDVAVDGGRIEAVGGHVPAGRAEIDGAGLTLAPGFVDVHTHDDAALVAHPGLEFKLAQGCTSVVIGNCGFSAMPAIPGAPVTGVLAGLRTSWEDLDGFRDVVHQRGPACNAMALIGHNTMRSATDDIVTIRGWVEQAMEQGACGLSTGLIYAPGRRSPTEEIIAIAQPVGEAGGLYATHMRNEGDHLIEAVEETLAIGSAAHVAVHISHHKAAGPANWGKVVQSLELVDAANSRGANVTLDVYPYTAGSGPMIQYFNLDAIDLALASVIRLASCPAFPAYEGRALTDIAAAQNVDLAALVRAILTAPGGEETICIQFVIDEADIETNLRHPLMMVGSDGIPDLRGKPHPRLYGTFPRVLGEYVRQRGVLSLPDAVRRMTSLSCRRFGLTDRGEIAEGYWADLVLFDPASIVDRATYDDPHQEPAGIELVVVNGEVAYDHGRHTGAAAGRLLHYRDPDGY